MKMLITKSDFYDYVELSKNVEDEKLFPHIRNAELQHVRLTLGGELYNDFKEQFDNENLESDYETLLDQYIKPYHVWAAYVSYLVYNDKQSSATGFKKLTGENSELLSENESSSLVRHAQDQTRFYKGELETFLEMNDKTYTKYKCKQQKNSFQITSIGRKDVKIIPTNLRSK